MNKSRLDMAAFNLVTHDEAITGLIEGLDQKVLAQWALECLERQRHLVNEDYRLEHGIIDKALETLKMWMHDKLSMWEARKYCWKVLETARNIEKQDKVACQILRATSHTLATCHVYTHSEGSAMYVISALQHYHKDNPDQIEIMREEREWQINRLIELKNQNL